MEEKKGLSFKDVLSVLGAKPTDEREVHITFDEAMMAYRQGGSEFAKAVSDAVDVVTNNFESKIVINALLNADVVTPERLAQLTMIAAVEYVLNEKS